MRRKRHDAAFGSEPRSDSERRTPGRAMAMLFPLALAICTCGTVRGQATFEIFEAFGDETTAHGINPSGAAVAGSSVWAFGRTGTFWTGPSSFSQIHQCDPFVTSTSDRLRAITSRGNFAGDAATTGGQREAIRGRGGGVFIPCPATRLGFFPLANPQFSIARGIADNGTTGFVVVGNATDQFGNTQGFFRADTDDRLRLLVANQGLPGTSAHAISDDASTIVGENIGGGGQFVAVRWRNFLGQPSAVGTRLYDGRAYGTNADGTVVVGVNLDGEPARWRESTGQLQALTNGAIGEALDVSADGNVVVGWTQFAAAPDGRRAQVWLASGGFGIEDRLELFGIDLDDWHLSDAVGVSADGLTIAGNAERDGERRAYRVRLLDLDENGTADVLEHFHLVGLLQPSGVERFRTEPGFETYGDLIAYYGAPWDSDAVLQPEFSSDVAARVRANVVYVGVPEYDSRVIPTQRDLARFELALGNEAFGDAADSTVGLGLVDIADLGDAFAFAGVSGVDTPIDEELALLRGRELPGSPDDWLDDSHYPSIGGVRVAVYNRLPPNFPPLGDDPSGTVAYRSTYLVDTDTEAAERFPQGHGDAWGYYLRARAALADVIAIDPEIPSSEEGETTSYVASLRGEAAADLELLGRAMTARARTAARVVEVTFRRDYRERPSEVEAEALLADVDAERAWSMAEWGHRGGLGAYLDWALLAHVTPPDDDAEAAVTREALPELAEIAALGSEVQERVDAAGSGLDPLGLVHNAVPFGIDVAELGTNSGRSHYEQVRDAAQRAIDNARTFFEHANDAGERLREIDESRENFEEQLEDLTADVNGRLIEIFGLPPTGAVGADPEGPDLELFLLDDAALAARGLGTRPAPGEIQLALSDLRVAGIRLDQANEALDDWQSEVADLMGFIEELDDAAGERLTVIAEACAEEISVLERAKRFRRLRGALDEIKSGIKYLTVDAFDLVPGFAIFNGILVAISPLPQTIAAAEALLFLDEELRGDSSVEQERARINCWKDAKLQGIDDRIARAREVLRLEDLLRESPRLILDIAAATEILRQAAGRLDAAVQRGNRLLAERERLTARLESDIASIEFDDAAFRVFRNRALADYDAFFEIAQRYTVLAVRAFAYEFNSRDVEQGLVSRVYSMRTIGASAGLESVLIALDTLADTNRFNQPFEDQSVRPFSLRRHLLGIEANGKASDLRFRAELESSIVERVEQEPFVRDYLKLSSARDFGPAIVLAFSTELDGRNVFGEGPDEPFGNTALPLSRNLKIRTFGVRFEGVDESLAADEFGAVTVFLVPTGESILRENTNAPTIEEEALRYFPTFDVFLPAPRLIALGDASSSDFNPWVASAGSNGDYLSEIKRYVESTAQIELGQEVFHNSTLAGRALWNTGWLLIIPGSQWTASSDPAVIRRKLFEFIHGADADPFDTRGITDIRWIVRLYAN